MDREYRLQTAERFSIKGERGCLEVDMKRGAGYCRNQECEEFERAVFLVSWVAPFDCPRCGERSVLEEERGFYTGWYNPVREVRVEYDFDVFNCTYRRVAIVRDEGLADRHRVYTLKSPLIQGQKRALRIAEAILANLRRYPEWFQDDEVPCMGEGILSWDEPFGVFQKKLQSLAEAWETGEPIAS